MKRTMQTFVWVSIFLLLISLSGYSQQAITIDVDVTSPVGELKPFWAGQTFHPTEYLSTEWGENLVRLMGESGAARTFIRLYNQPENAIRVADDGSISYDWSEFDRRARLILSTGAKPLVVFFGMPLQLAKYPALLKRRNFGAIVSLSPPKDYQHWEELCIDFTRHVMNEFGENEVEKWVFRCWNEPDLKGFWHEADVEEYNKLYDFFAHAVKEVNPDIKIGGGAFSSTATYKNPDQTREFFDHVTNGTNYATGETGSPIDYVSMHSYGGSGGAGGPRWEFPAVDYLMSIHRSYIEILDDYPQLKNLPLFMDEWGVSASGTKGMDAEPLTITRNNEFAAAFLATLVARQVDLEQMTGHRIGNMMLCVSGYERRRKHDFMGLRTLHTRNGFHKPLLNAYRVLDKMGKQLVKVDIRDENPHITALATKDDQKITVLVTNFQNDQPMGEGPFYPVSISVNSPGTGQKKVTHWRIDKEHSNAYTEYVKIGSPEFPNPLEMEQIRTKMHLEMIDSHDIDKSSDELSIDFDLPCNAVSLFEIY
jgi:xylan 1,4-beta-xylosidase